MIEIVELPAGWYQTGAGSVLHRFEPWPRNSQYMVPACGHDADRRLGAFLNKKPARRCKKCAKVAP